MQLIFTMFYPKRATNPNPRRATTSYASVATFDPQPFKKFASPYAAAWAARRYILAELPTSSWYFIRQMASEE
jgi:hypothetical protein